MTLEPQKKEEDTASGLNRKQKNMPNKVDE